MSQRPDPTVTLTLTLLQAMQLRHLFNETAEQMDDDGQEGAFDASPFKAIADHLRAQIEVAHTTLRTSR